MWVRKRLVILIGVLYFYVVLPAFAGRPLTTDDAGTVASGAVEVETGYTYAKNEGNIRSEEMTTTLKHGLTERMDLAITVPEGIRAETEEDISEFGLKFALLKEQKDTPAISCSFISPSGSSEYILNGIFTKTWDHVTIHLNLGYIDTCVAGEKDCAICAGAIELPYDDHLLLVAEIAGEAIRDEKNPLAILVGGSLQASDTLALDLGISFGLSEISPDWQVTLGLTYGF